MISKPKLWIVIAMALTVCACGSKEIASGLSQQEAQEMIAVLRENGLDAVTARTESTDRNAPPAWSLKVRGGAQNAVLAWRILQENGLPRQPVKGLEEVFSTTGMIPTASEEKARVIMALSGELSRTLQSIQGVVDARVQVVLPDNSPLLDKSQWNPTTASVLLKYHGAQMPLTEDEVKRVVARGVEGLQPDNVGVVIKKIEPVRQQPRDVNWYLRDQYVVMASLALMTISSIGSLALVFRNWRSRTEINELQTRLKAAEQSRVSA